MRPSTSEAQERVCKRYAVDAHPTESNDIVGWSSTAHRGAVPLHGLRHEPEGDTSGWYIWGGEELSSDPDFFEPLHACHLEERCPDVLPYLALPPGWRFLLAPDYVDAWFDETLTRPGTNA